jgi:co-chaperonin GroES (HSP10)
MNVVKGKLKPLHDNVLVTDMSFEEQTTASGIIIQSDDGKSHGVKPRWCRVWAVGPEQIDVKVGEWIYVDHGRWTRGIKVEDGDNEIVIRRVEVASILLQADERPTDAYLGMDSGTAPPNEAYRI